MFGIFSALRDWQARREVMREMRSFRAQEREWDHFKIRDMLLEAIAAVARADIRHATDLWEKALLRNPAEAKQSYHALDVLLGLKRYDEAASIMREGKARAPADPFYPLALARIAAARGDHNAAAELAAAARKRFPEVRDGYALEIQALRDLAKLPEADKCAQRAVGVFPDDIVIAMEYAKVADARKDWNESLARWNMVRQRFDWASSYAGEAGALRRLQRFDEAETLLMQGRLRYPIDPTVFIEWAYNAQNRGDTPEAIRRWVMGAERFPLHLPTCRLAAEELVKLDAFHEAERILTEATLHFPHEPSPLGDLGSLQMKQRDFAAAAETFARLRAAFPNQQAGYNLGADALLAAGRPQDAQAVRDSFRAAVP